MEIMNRNDLDMLVGLVSTEPPSTRSAVMSALLRGETPQMGVAQSFSPMPFEPPQAPQAQSMQPPQPRRALPQAMANYTPPPQQPQLPQPQPQQPLNYDQQMAQYEQQHAEAMQGLQEAMQPPDSSQMEDWQRKRNQSASTNALLGITAQEAGMAPLAKHYQDLSAADRENMKMTGGTLTPQGYIQDPGHNAALKVRSAEARVAAIERAQQNAVTLQSRRELEREKIDAQVELRRATMALQGQIAAQASADRRYIADLAHGDKVAKANAPKTLPAKTVLDMTNDAQKVGTLQRLSQDFKPEYGGIEGGLMNVAGKLPGVTTESAEWWRNYKKESELIERHGLFGASLTQGESQEWRAADINPSMHPDAIRRNLQRRAEVIRRHYNDSVKRLGGSGYNVEAFPEEAAPAAPGATPSGVSTEDLLKKY